MQWRAASSDLRRAFLATLTALWAIVWTVLGAGTGHAADYVETDGPLDDDTFYRIVSCGAEPGGPCAYPPMHWPTTRPLKLAIVRIDHAYLGGKQNRAHAAVSRAVQYINRAGSGIRLQHTEDPDNADIKIYLVDTDGSYPISGTGITEVDGQSVGGARVRVWARNGQIKRAVIIFSLGLHIREYESAMIEEVTQSLGLLTDIKNTAYNGVSIFAEDSNASKDLGPQDRMALRRHYPPKR